MYLSLKAFALLKALHAWLQRKQYLWFASWSLCPWCAGAGGAGQGSLSALTLPACCHCPQTPSSSEHHTLPAECPRSEPQGAAKAWGYHQVRKPERKTEHSRECSDAVNDKLPFRPAPANSYLNSYRDSFHLLLFERLEAQIINHLDMTIISGLLCD